MVDLRKSLLLLVAFAVFASVALAQPTVPTNCAAQAGVPPIIRTEGLTEQVGDLVLICTGGTPTAAGTDVPRINIQVFLNARVTSQILASSSLGVYTEALMLIDEPQPAEQLTCPDSGAWVAILNTCAITATGNPAETYDGSSTRPNVFQGRLAGNLDSSTPSLLQATSVGFFGIPFDPPGTTWTRVLRITNVKIDATNRLGSGDIPTQILMLVSISNSQSITLSNPQQTVAFVQRSINFSTIGNSTFLQCEPPTSVCPAFAVRFTELQVAAFKVRNLGGPLGTTYQNNPGQVLFTEDGFWNGDYGNTQVTRGNLGLAGRSTQGTRLIARFNKIPAGIDLWVTTTGRNPSTVGTIAANLTQANSSGAGAYLPVSGTTLDSTNAGDDCDWVPQDDGDPTYQIAKLTIGTDANGDRFATATWEIEAADLNLAQSIDFGVVVQFTAGQLPEISDDASVNGHFAPLSTANTATTRATAPYPRFVMSGPDSQDGLFAIIRCRTNLLFPFVTNNPGRFDTGFAVSNTSDDPGRLSDSNLRAGWDPRDRRQEGPCRIYYYGCTADDGPPPPPDETTVVPAGKFITWNLSSGGPDYGINNAATFAGYVIVSCEFQYAHGYAFISDLGAETFAQGYVALVMDASLYRFSDGTYNEPITRTNVRSENLDQ